MAYDLNNIANRNVVLGLSGGVDSAVAAFLLKEAGAHVQALHMTNWEDNDGYCKAAEDLQDARRVCERLGIPLHHVNFAKQYRDRVFNYFLSEYRAGRTPNPDVLCNREIKFGVFRDYAKRLGGELLATGHYARTASIDGVPALLKGADPGKDQSYFLHAITAEAISETVFPLGHLVKKEVRQIARELGLSIHDKKDSTGICFIGERPFRQFLQQYLPANPGRIESISGDVVGEHAGLMYYTPGQRQGLGIGGRNDADNLPWYVVDKRVGDNVLVVDQGESPWLFCSAISVGKVHWIGAVPEGADCGRDLRVKLRYRQPDQRCTLAETHESEIQVTFAEPQRAVAPGQYAVFYDGERCLGGAVIEQILSRPAFEPRIAAFANS